MSIHFQMSLQSCCRQAVNTTSAPRRLGPLRRQSRRSRPTAPQTPESYPERPPAVLFKLPETVPPSRLSPPSAPDKPGRKAIRSVSVRFCSGYRRISRWLLLAPSEGARKYSSRTYATRKCKGPQCPSRCPWL